MAACPHLSFQAAVHVVRLSDTDDGPVRSYSVEMSCSCSGCGERLVFSGPVGLAPDGLTVAVPCRAEHDPTFGLGLEGQDSGN